MFFISEALAQTTSTVPSGAASWASFLPMLLIFALMFFLIILPQRKQQKEHKTMLESIAKNDEILTNGGIVGKVVEVKDNFVQIDVGENQLIWLQKQAIATLLPKDTIKNL